MTIPGSYPVQTENVSYCIDDQGKECIEYDLKKGNCGKDTSLSALFGLNYVGFGEASNPLLNQTASTDDIVQHWSLHDGTKMTFHLKKDPNTAHILTVNNLTESSIDMTITSDSVTVNMNVGDTEEVDIDNDGKKDIQFNLESIDQTGSYGLVASMLYTQLETAPVTDDDSGDKDEGVIDKLVSTGSNTIIIIGSALVVLLAILLYYLIKKRKDNQKNYNY